MKSNRILLAAAASFILTLTAHAAESLPPTYRESGEWIIVSGEKNWGDGQRPWTFAIRKASVKSVSVEADSSRVKGANDGSNMAFEKLSAEERRTLPVIISITTDELESNGANKSYNIYGLTRDTSDGIFEKILDAAKTGPAK